MCDHDDDLEPDPEPKGLSRRSFLRGTAALGATLLVPGTSRLFRPVPASAGMTSALAPSGLRTVSNAMHIHASFSELDGSFDGHLSEATRCGIDCVWWTDHDWRMMAYHYLTTLRFTKPETSNGTSVTYHPVTSGSLTSSICALDSRTTSPGDPSGGALHVMAKGSGSRRMNVQPSDHLRSNLTGETMRFDVLPITIGARGWLEVLVNLSYHPPQAGRPAGTYQLSYRLGTKPAGRTAQGLLGVVTVPVTAGQWNRGIVLDPVGDIAALWPDLAAPGDNNMNDLWFGATAQKGAAEGYFADVLLARSQTSGDDPITVQRSIVASLADRYPVPQSRHALEISLNAKHSNWFGGDFHMPVYGQDLPVNADATAQATKLIHGYGGLASVNHPFGVKKRLNTQSAQDKLRHKVAVKYLGNHVYGADVLEAGYHERGGASLETHLALWDTISRNGLFLTGSGVSDNHTGHVNGWSKDRTHNTFQTTLWAASDGESDLLDALRAGRAYCGEILAFTGDVWQEVDGNPMGSVSVSSAATRSLAVAVTGLASSSVVEVVLGPVDYAGSQQPDPATAVVATLPASAFRDGTATVTVDTTSSCFVRVNVYDTSVKRRLAFGNPNWLLRSAPPGGIPAARLAPDTPAA